MDITIKDKVFKLKYTLRALFIFEQITGKMFSMQTITDEYIFFYSLLLANNPDEQLTFNDLIEALDEDPSVMVLYLEFMLKEMDKQKQFNIKETPDSKKKL